MQELALTLNKITNSNIVETKFRESFTMAGQKVEGLSKVSKISLARPSTKTDYLAEGCSLQEFRGFYKLNSQS